MTTLTAVSDAAKAARKNSSWDCVLLVGHDPGRHEVAEAHVQRRVAAVVGLVGHAGPYELLAGTPVVPRRGAVQGRPGVWGSTRAPRKSRPTLGGGLPDAGARQSPNFGRPGDAGCRDASSGAATRRSTRRRSSASRSDGSAAK